VLPLQPNFETLSKNCTDFSSVHYLCLQHYATPLWAYGVCSIFWRMHPHRLMHSVHYPTCLLHARG